MKKIIALLITCVLVFSAVSASAEEVVKVYINGVQVISDVDAIIVKDRTMLPFRAIFNGLGVTDDEIKWRESSMSIEVKSTKGYIFLVVGSEGAVVNDKMIMLDSQPFIRNDRTMVPVRFIAESLNAKVTWDESAKSVYIEK